MEEVEEVLVEEEAAAVVAAGSREDAAEGVPSVNKKGFKFVKELEKQILEGMYSVNYIPLDPRNIRSWGVWFFLIISTVLLLKY